MLPTFRQTNTSNMSSFMYLLLLLMDWDDRSCTCCYLIQIHIYKVSDRSVGNFHNLVFCIFLINQVGLCMFDTTFMYSQLSRTSPHTQIWLNFMFRVKKCWTFGAQICHESLHMCRVCVYLRSMTSIWVVVQIVVGGDGHCWNLLCMSWWSGFSVQKLSIVILTLCKTFKTLC